MGTGKTYSTKYLLDSNNSSGVAGQVLSTTSTGIDWVNANTLPGAGLWIENGNDIYNSNSGNVGIGITNAGTKLFVVGNVSVSAGKAYRMYNAANNGWGEMSFIETDNRIQFNRGIQNSGVDWRFPDSGDSYVNANDGNFGIGTTGPGAKLEVNGNVKIATTGVSDNLLLTSADTSASSAPDIVMYRTAAIADSDTLGVLEYRGKNGMVPGSATPVTYSALYSRIVDASANQSMLSINTNKGNGGGAFKQAVHIAAIGTNNSATGAILINPSSDFQLPAYNLDVKGTGSFTGLVSGIAPVDPANLVTKAYVDSSAGNPSYFRQGHKNHNLTNAFTTCLTVNLTNHTGCYVTICVWGDWGSHSAAAYRGEFFLQNGANAYNEPGIILRQDDNTSNTGDQIVCQILDPTSTANPKDFNIQIRTTATSGTTSFAGLLTFTVQGKFNSVT